MIRVPPGKPTGGRSSFQVVSHCLLNSKDKHQDFLSRVTKSPIKSKLAGNNRVVVEQAWGIDGSDEGRLSPITVPPLQKTSKLPDFKTVPQHSSLSTTPSPMHRRSSIAQIGTLVIRSEDRTQNSFLANSHSSFSKQDLGIGTGLTQ